ncbi:hypothetical protein [Oceanobacillus halophilus]|uniref:Uncharacterized protein n=1 Tax=Oceanobacillus halophilus TaxID=930130 RepID=A0A494ZRV1_9BACI|nr:hypothetical protein [Oceanobacillus halophilus]RKQ28209.1 hypothetical protein D8M06_19120 [Oceanobacillus halophilus]
MLIFWTYIDKLNHPNNDEAVLEILTDIFENDLLDENSQKEISQCTEAKGNGRRRYLSRS